MTEFSLSSNLKSDVNNKVNLAIQVINQPNVMKEVLDSIECPVCLESLQPPIFMCETGHNICGDCRQKLESLHCPICQDVITYRRNFALETISSKIISVPCPNTVYGCTAMFPTEKVPSHINKCEFKPFLCIIGRELKQCSQNVSLSTILEHFKQQHPKEIAKAGEIIVLQNFNIDEYNSIKLIHFENYNFFFNFHIDLQENAAYCCIYFADKKKKARMWEYQFSIYNSNFSSIIFSGKCDSLFRKSTEIFNSGSCIGIPLKTLQKFTQKDNSLTIKISFKSLQPNIS